MQSVLPVECKHPAGVGVGNWHASPILIPQIALTCRFASQPDAEMNASGVVAQPECSAMPFESVHAFCLDAAAGLIAAGSEEPGQHAPVLTPGPAWVCRSMGACLGSVLAYKPGILGHMQQLTLSWAIVDRVQEPYTGLHRLTRLPV